MNIERLEMMRVMMERVVAGSWTPDNTILSEIHRPTTLPLKVDRLNLYSWRTRTGDDANACGFSACAVGHACFDEEFRKLGWSWSGQSPMFNGDDSWSGVTEFFGIRDRTAKLLFVNENYSYTVRNGYKGLPKKVREAKMVADRVAHLMHLKDELQFAAHHNTIFKG